MSGNPTYRELRALLSYPRSSRGTLTKKRLLHVFGLPLAILILGCIPVLNVMLYSGHGGPFWLLLPFCFPYILIRLLIELRRLPPPNRKRGSKMAGVSVLLYILVAFPITRWTEHSVTSWSGLPIPPGTMFKLATLPVGFLLPPYHLWMGSANQTLTSMPDDAAT
jgi:hypothetical protein